LVPIQESRAHEKQPDHNGKIYLMRCHGWRRLKKHAVSPARVECIENPEKESADLGTERIEELKKLETA